MPTDSVYRYYVVPGTPGIFISHFSEPKQSNQSTFDKTRFAGRSATHVFPTGHFSPTPGTGFMYLMRTVTTSVTTTRQDYDVYKPNAPHTTSEVHQRMIDFCKKVIQEDIDLCNAIQTNLGRGVYTSGRLHPSHEEGVLVFQNIVEGILKGHVEEEQKAGKRCSGNGIAAGLSRTSPTDPEIFGGPQQIFIEIRHYVFGSFDSRTWLQPTDGHYFFSAKQGGDADVTSDFNDSLFGAITSLNGGSYGKAGQFLIRGSALIRDMLLQENPRMLTMLFNVIVMLRNGWVDCSNMILKQLSRMANTVFPKLHPVRHIFNHLKTLDSELAEEVFANAWESFSDVCDQAMGASSISALAIRVEYIFRIVRVRNADKAEAQLRAMVERCKEHYGSLDQRYGAAVLGFADFLRLQKRYTEAAAAAEEGVRCTSEGSFPNATEMWCNGMERLALCQYGNYDDDLAESTLRQVIDVSSTTWGGQDELTLRLLQTLEGWLTKFGKHEEAAQVSEHMEEIMSQSNVLV